MTAFNVARQVYGLIKPRQDLGEVLAHLFRLLRRYTKVDFYLFAAGSNNEMTVHASIPPNIAVVVLADMCGSLTGSQVVRAQVEALLLQKLNSDGNCAGCSERATCPSSSSRPEEVN